MGAKLSKCYDIVREHGGITAQMRLAMKTSLSSIKAAEAPDTKELVDKFRAVVRELTGKEPVL